MTWGNNLHLRKTCAREKDISDNYSFCSLNVYYVLGPVCTLAIVSLEQPCKAQITTLSF